MDFRSRLSKDPRWFRLGMAAVYVGSILGSFVNAIPEQSFFAIAMDIPIRANILSHAQKFGAVTLRNPFMGCAVSAVPAPMARIQDVLPKRGQLRSSHCYIRDTTSHFADPPVLST